MRLLEVASSVSTRSITSPLSSRFRSGGVDRMVAALGTTYEGLFKRIPLHEASLRIGVVKGLGLGMDLKF